MSVRLLFSLLLVAFYFTKNSKKFFEMSAKPIQDPEVIDLVSDSEEEEFLPMFGPLPEPYQGPVPYQDAYGVWIYPPGCPNVGWGLPQQEAQPPQIHGDPDDWSDEYQLANVSDDSNDDDHQPDEPAQPALPAEDEGYPLLDADFVEENVGHEVISESSDSGRNSENES